MLTGSCHKTCVIRYPIISLGWQALFMDQWLSCAYCFIGSIESVKGVTIGQQSPPISTKQAITSHLNSERQRKHGQYKNRVIQWMLLVNGLYYLLARNV
jgi:hypothetical protein